MIDFKCTMAPRAKNANDCTLESSFEEKCYYGTYTEEPFYNGNFNLNPDIFGHFLLQYRGFPLSEVKNALRTPAGTKRFFLIMYYAIAEASNFLHPISQS